jgi:predicted glycosyltransferase
MKFLFYLGHPAQYFFFRNTLRTLLINEHKVIILLKTKDVLETLVNNDGFEYLNIQQKPRKNNKLSIITHLLKRNLRILPIILREKPDLMIGGDPSISQLGWLLRKNRITLTEDDYPVIKTLANLTFPFAQAIICPKVCDTGKWTFKKIGYDGYMKLSYLHPNIFTPNNQVPQRYGLTDNFVLIRLAKLTAHHDFGIQGIDNNFLANLISKFNLIGLKVCISSESELESEFQQYSLKIQPSDMHDVLSFETMLVSDSQSMSVESSILGVPSLRYSDFSGKISVLEELEHKYSLTYGFPVSQEKQLLSKVDELLKMKDLRAEFQFRRNKMLNDKINVSEFFTWLISNWPKSFEIMKVNPDYQNNFK